MKTVFVTEEIHPDGLALLRKEPELEVVESWKLGEAAKRAALARAQAILVRIDLVDALMIAAAPDLMLISKHGVGCDNIDLAAARAAGALITVTADANAASVAEHTLALLLAAAKNLRASDLTAREDYTRRGCDRSVDIAGKRALIFGYGRIGKRVAQLLQAFSVDVTYWDPALKPEDRTEWMSAAKSLGDALSGTDILTIHAPLTAETRNVIDRVALERLAPGAIVINCARGGIVDEAALAELARSGHIGGVGVDVFSVEPIAPDNPLLTVENAILTPHVAAMTGESMRRMSRRAAQNVLDGFAGALDPEMLYQD